MNSGDVPYYDIASAVFMPFSLSSPPPAGDR